MGLGKIINEMKNSVIYICLLSIFMNNAFSQTIDQVNLSNQEILKGIDYFFEISEITNKQKGVIQLRLTHLEPIIMKDSTETLNYSYGKIVYYITLTSSIGFIEKYPPLYWFEHNGRPVLVYLGYENLIKPNSKSVKKLIRKINYKLDKPLNLNIFHLTLKFTWEAGLLKEVIRVNDIPFIGNLP